LRTGTVGSSRRGAPAAIAGVLLVAALAGAILLSTAAGGSGGSYRVRAIFDDAGNLVPSEDVKIDGVKVGTVGPVAPTPQGKAAVTLEINNPGFQDFRADASCTIEPQALIGEKYVTCLPTQQRPEGTPLPPPLHRVPAGQEGAGEWLLPVTNTSSPVGVDLLSDINHLPEHQRLAIIINEFGAGLAGRGSDLNAVLHRSNPALRELEKVFGILASENKVLGNLAVEGNRALIPIARDRRQFSEFFAHSNTVATATARHRGELAENLREFPTFLREFKPYLKHLDQFAEQSVPTFTDLGVAAPGIDRTFKNAPGIANSSTQFFQTLGQDSKGIGKALVSSQPFLGRLEKLGAAAKPFASNLSGLLSSLRSTGGLERFMDFIFLGTNTANGYNSLGHFLRAGIVSTICVAYKTVTSSGCEGNFPSSSAAPASAAANASDTSLAMERIIAIAHGATAAQAIAAYPGSEGPGSEATASPFGGGGSSAGASAPVAQPVGGASAGTTYYTPSSEGSEAGGLLLNYLLGN
jgi:phospholipid/cholesterol/gamma-HCH transport system substrate-binding protein